MAIWHDCWRCRTKVPLLDESEWSEIAPLLTGFIKAIQTHREQHGSTIAEARAVVADTACAKFAQLTGFVETNVDAIWHHRRSLWGPPCAHCGQLLRTSKSRRCFSCGQLTAASKNAGRTSPWDRSC